MKDSAARHLPWSPGGNRTTAGRTEAQPDIDITLAWPDALPALTAGGRDMQVLLQRTMLHLPPKCLKWSSLMLMNWQQIFNQEFVLHLRLSWFLSRGRIGKLARERQLIAESLVHPSHPPGPQRGDSNLQQLGWVPGIGSLTPPIAAARQAWGPEPGLLRCPAKHPARPVTRGRMR